MQVISEKQQNNLKIVCNLINETAERQVRRMSEFELRLQVNEFDITVK